MSAQDNSLQQQDEGEAEAADAPESRNEVSVAGSQPDHFGRQVDFLRLCQYVLRTKFVYTYDLL